MSNAAMDFDDFDYEPASEEEVLNLLPKGEYDFVVSKWEPSLSKAGNRMVKLTLQVWDANGKPRLVFANLVPTFKKHFKHFCDATGLEKEYAEKKFKPSMCEGRSGRVKLMTKEDDYGVKTVVDDYVKRQPKQETKAADTFDDNLDVPF